MTLSQRVKEYRYERGLGSDELASRAAVSRTAIYNIENGKTELPRAATLRRLAGALDVSMETLLGQDGSPRPVRAGTSRNTARAQTSQSEWRSVPTRLRARDDAFHDSRFVVEYVAPCASNPLGQEQELVHKLHELLDSPLGSVVASIVEAMYRLLPATCPLND